MIGGTMFGFMNVGFFLLDLNRLRIFSPSFNSREYHIYRGVIFFYSIWVVIDVILFILLSAGLEVKYVFDPLSLVTTIWGFIMNIVSTVYIAFRIYQSTKWTPDVKSTKWLKYVRVVILLSASIGSDVVIMVGGIAKIKTLNLYWKAISVLINLWTVVELFKDFLTSKNKSEDKGSHSNHRDDEEKKTANSQSLVSNGTNDWTPNAAQPMMNVNASTVSNSGPLPASTANPFGSIKAPKDDTYKVADTR